MALPERPDRESAPAGNDSTGLELVAGDLARAVARMFAAQPVSDWPADLLCAFKRYCETTGFSPVQTLGEDATPVPWPWSYSNARLEDE